jgi:hypothetical protein
MEGINMPVINKKVFDEALLLPVEARATLAEKLFTSFKSPSRPEIDRLWADEVEKRIAQIDKGEVKPVPGKKFFLISGRNIGDDILLPSGCRSRIL